MIQGPDITKNPSSKILYGHLGFQSGNLSMLGKKPR
jgi:hypothetical protein